MSKSFFTVNQIALIIILCYMALGVAVFCFGIDQMDAVDACYFAIVTMLTIGNS